jgi:hypothetical protein
MALLFANNSSLANITALPSSVSGGGLNLIKTQTASSSSSISFVNGVDGVVLDGTYKEYIFKFINIHPASSGIFTFNMSTDSGSTYAVTKTSTFFYSRQNESGSPAELSYEAGYDLAQSTSYQNLTDVFGTNSDDSCSGYLHLFAPSSNTYVKHFLATVNNTYSIESFIAGYGNTTSAINAVDFKFSSGNTNDGIIKLYGVS